MSIDLITASPKLLCKLPLFRPVSIRIQHELDGHTEFARLARLASLDPSIAIELLVAANSPVYGFASKIYTVHDAVMILGWEHAKRLIRAAVETESPVDPQTESLIKASWAHCLAVAFLASELARVVGLPEDRAYSLGLMHDIGRLGMLSASPGRYLDLLAFQYVDPMEFLGAEECAIGMNHCKAGSWLARVWGLPAQFAEVAASHHDLVLTTDRPAAALVGLACRLAHTGGFAVEDCKQTVSKEVICDAPPEWLGTLHVNLSDIEGRSRATLLECAEPFCDLNVVSSLRLRGEIGVL
jgi:putative nucleotidyltransferase with HDIG domain